MQLVEMQLNTLPGLESVSDTVTIPALSEPNEYVPEKDPYCVFSLDIVRNIVGFLQKPTPGGLKFTGPTGAGKSYQARQFHAYTNRPFFWVSGHDTVEFEDLIAIREIVDGDTLTSYGPLTQAAMMEHATFLFEEIDRAKSSCTVGLIPILDGYDIVNTLDGGTRIKQQPGFKFMATGNTSGNGDLTGEYNTAQVADAALSRRFWDHKVNYLEPEHEFRVLRRVVSPQYEDDNLRRSIALANDVRFLHMGQTNDASAVAQADAGRNAIHTTFSTDTLIEFWQAMEIFSSVPNPVEYALKLVLTNRCTPECSEAIHRLADAQFAGDV